MLSAQKSLCWLFPSSGKGMHATYKQNFIASKLEYTPTFAKGIKPGLRILVGMDPHYFGTLAPDPHQTEMLDPESDQSSKVRSCRGLK